MLKQSSEKGFSLVELMITLTLSLVLMLGIYKVYSSFVSSGMDNLREARLQQEMHTVMHKMSRELRRATTEVTYATFDWNTDIVLKVNSEDVGSTHLITPGNPGSFPVVNEGEIGPILGAGPAFGNGRVRLDYYKGNGASAHGTVLTAFTNLPSNGKLKPGEWFVVEPNVTSYGEATRVLDSGECILFSYDKNKNLEIENDANTNEQFGFRLTTSSGVGTVEQRTGGTFTDCSTGNWVALTNPNLVNITNLDFTVSSTDVSGDAGGTISRKKITISITGELVGNSSYTKTLTKSVNVRNDQYE